MSDNQAIIVPRLKEAVFGQTLVLAVRSHQRQRSNLLRHSRTVTYRHEVKAFGSST
jgi:hypothetical protein